MRERPRIPPLASLIPAAGVQTLLGMAASREQRIAFGPDRHQYALAYLPEGIPGTRPLVLFLHAGSWRGGSAGEYRFVGRFLYSHGWPAIVAGYRHAPQHRWPAQLDDAYGALAVVRLALPGVGGRPVVLCGFSAGGQIAAVMATAPDAEDRLGASLAGLLTVGAPLDFAAFGESAAIEDLTGHAGPWPEADPLSLLRSAPPAALIVQGLADDLVPSEGARRYAAALAAVSPAADVRLLEVPWMTHGEGAAIFVEGRARESEHVLAWLDALERD